MPFLGGMHAVRRMLVATVVLAVLAVPGTAFGSAFFKGPVNGGANNAGVEFRVHFRNHQPRKVLEFRWFNIPVPPNCADSFEGTKFNMKVHARRFHGTYKVPNTNHKAIVHGRIKHSNKKAVGTLRLKGSFAGGCVDADTGDLNWVARKANG